MANTTTGLFETLVAAFDDAAHSLTYKTTMLDSVNTSLHPNYATIGNVLNFVVPTVDISLATNIGAGDVSVTDTDHSNVAVTFNKKYASTFVIRNFDQVRTP